MTEFDQKILLKLIGDVYDAALDPSLWRSFIDTVRSAVGAEVGVMFYLDRRPDVIASRQEDMVWSGYDVSILKSYEDYFAAREVRAPPFFNVPCGAVYADDRDMSFLAIKGSEIHNDFYVPLRADGHCLVMKLFQQDNRYGALTVHKAHDTPFRDHELKLFEALAPHVVRALQLQHQAEAFRLRTDTAETMLGGVGMGFILVGRGGFVRHASPMAERLLASGDALTVSHRQLRAVRPLDTSALLRRIAEAATLADGKGAGVGSAILLERPNNVPVSVLVCPIRPSVADFGTSEPMAMVLVHDPAATGKLSADATVKFFGLTSAEATLLVALCDGERLADFAEHKGIAVATAKTQLQSIFDKLGRNRQADVIRTIVGDPIFRMPARR